MKKQAKQSEKLQNKINQLLNEKEIQNNKKLVELLTEAEARLNKGESIRSVASNLAFQLKENFNEQELPKDMIDLQLKLERWASFGANNGFVL